MSSIFSYAYWPFVYLPWRNVYSDVYSGLNSVLPQIHVSLVPVNVIFLEIGSLQT